VCQKIIEKKNNDKDYFKSRCGLPINPYFSALKIKWIIQNNEIVIKKVQEGDLENLCFGTIDSWLIFVTNFNLYFNTFVFMKKFI